MLNKEISIFYDKHHKLSSLVKVTKTHTILSNMKYCNMKMSNNPAIYEIINKLYLRSIRNIPVSEKTYKVRNFMNYCAIQANPTQWMVALLAAVNHLNGPLKEQKLPSISSKSHIYRL